MQAALLAWIKMHASRTVLDVLLQISDSRRQLDASTVTHERRSSMHQAKVQSKLAGTRPNNCCPGSYNINQPSSGVSLTNRIKEDCGPLLAAFDRTKLHR